MASSSSSVQQKHQVFLSFRGEDTRNNFTSHLYAALERKGIDTFIDNKHIRGEEISQALSTAIEESKISIIVLSKNYAASSWCLDELSKILDCHRTNGHKTLPIFYHVDPSDVRKQMGSFAEAFAKHEQHFKDRLDKVERWRADLKEAANLSGWHLRTQLNDRLESEVIVEIIEHISKELIYKSLYDTKSLVGIDSRIKQIEPLLCMDLADVRTVGIWGMGGIGKTTIAEAIYNRFFSEFEGCCFLANVREELNYGQVRLREELFSKILEDRNLNVGTSSLPAFINDRLHRKRIFIVLDDINDSMQLDLLPEKHCLGPGSRIIVTSRDKQVLLQVVDVIYEVEGLIDDEALQLFSLYAFKQCHPKEDFMELSKKVVHYAKGIPLALRVLGSALYGKSKLDWEGDLKKLKEIPNPKIDNMLRISYDGLDREVKDIFLDIACFFKRKDRYYVTSILDGCYISAMSGISVIIEKSLITISHNKLEIHDLLQQMGWNIVCQESKEPGKRSRLWIPKDVYHVLKNNTGTETIEGMFVDMSKIGKLCLQPIAFARMYNLKFLKFYYSNLKRERNVYLSQQGLESLPDNLSYLHWDDYPSKSLPSNFFPENLVVLSMPNSHVKRLWNGVQNLVKLKRLNLRQSQHLMEIPDLSRATNLERMELDGCTSLVEVPSSIGCLSRVKYLKMTDCKRLERLPNSICKLKFLEELHLNGCLKLESFPEILETMERLKYLYLSRTSIEELHSSIEHLVGLVTLRLDCCQKLKNLPSSIRKLKSLKHLSLVFCSNITNFQEIPENLKTLNLSGNAIEQLPSSIECLSELRQLHLQDCTKLESLPRSIFKSKSLHSLCVSGFSKLEGIQELLGIVQALNIRPFNGTAEIELYWSIEHLQGFLSASLSFNELESLRNSIGNMKSLQKLSVSGSSVFDGWLGNLENLESLNIFV